MSNRIGNGSTADHDNITLNANTGQIYLTWNDSVARPSGNFTLKTINFSWAPRSTGTFTINVIVDTNGNRDENNESDNSDSINVTVMENHPYP